MVRPLDILKRERERQIAAMEGRPVPPPLGIPRPPSKVPPRPPKRSKPLGVVVGLPRSRTGPLPRLTWDESPVYFDRVWDGTRAPTGKVTPHAEDRAVERYGRPFGGSEWQALHDKALSNRIRRWGVGIDFETGHPRFKCLVPAEMPVEEGIWRFTLPLILERHRDRAFIVTLYDPIGDRPC